MATYAQIRKLPEILDMISEVENGNYYGETDFDKMVHLFYEDVKLILGYRGDEE
tara:strand:+ start:723 stop:884 length:162 start_codon:yes stop_codon:yes gene_type:complete